ncbi:MAG TPA: hypothetical protein VGY98_19765 [Verrucomicrobiae bacterium]|nr:hypothetical protein [Verrucomicrobiae bacterium]
MIDYLESTRQPKRRLDTQGRVLMRFFGWNSALAIPCARPVAQRAWPDIESPAVPRAIRAVTAQRAVHTIGKVVA